MSKTKQRKESAYYLGLKDARQNKHFRWSRHPQLSHYRRGYRHGVEERIQKDWDDFVQGKNGHEEL